jgi:tRNA-Thr(GGU) m(6)t(6)A37 methyltransferase TsaA
MNELLGTSLKAIGIVRNGVKQPRKQDWEKVVSDIVVESSLTEALDGLEDFSHIVVVYWMHRVTATDKLPTKVHPRGRQELPIVGLFATRSTQRPNPLGITTIRLLKRLDNVLKVEGLDAIDGTPVIDIKPHLPGYDSAANTEVALWITKR